MKKHIIVGAALLAVLTVPALGGEARNVVSKNLYCPDGQRYAKSWHGSNCTDPVPMSTLCPDAKARCKVRDNPSFYSKERAND